MTTSSSSTRQSALHISVVMPTYNGDVYLEEQLTSILEQARRPDEVIILDDASEDGTGAKIEAWARSAPFPVTTVRRTRNIGLNSNIADGIQRASGDVLVLADQDDIWEVDKLTHVERAFGAGATSVWFSNASLVDSLGADLGITSWEAVRFGALERHAVEAGTSHGLLRLLRGMTVTGATMAFTKEVATFALPLPDGIVGRGGWLLHDGWIALIGFLCGEVVADPTPLIRYRQHDTQATARAMLNAARPSVATPAGDIDVEAERTSAIAEVVRERALPASPQVDILFELREYRLRRQGILHGRRVVTQLSSNIRTGAYTKFARGWRTAAKDLGRGLNCLRHHGKNARSQDSTS